MITLHILQMLQDEGFGTIDQDLFFEKLTLGKKGLYITSRGSELTRTTRRVQAFDIYARGVNDVDGANTLEDVIELLKEKYGDMCTLPTVPNISDTQYVNVTIEPTGNIESSGLDDNNRVIYVMSGLIRYDIIK